MKIQNLRFSTFFVETTERLETALKQLGSC